MILYDSPLRFPGTGDQEISKESSWHKGEGKQPSQLLSENILGEMAVPSTAPRGGLCTHRVWRSPVS